MTPFALRTEYACDPPAVDASSPQFRWRVDANERGAAQTACRVQVTRADTLGEPRWDSGKRHSKRAALAYDGPPLESGARYRWRVRVWDGERESDWSDPATFRVGLDGGDWNAEWLRRPEEENADAFERNQFTYFRRGFTLDGPVESARACVAASHAVAFHANGAEIGRGPAPCYPDEQYYRTFDLTEQLREGENAVGALHTWAGPGQGRPAAEPGFCCRLVVELADGDAFVLTTDDTWRVRDAEWRDAPLRNDETAEPVEEIDLRAHPEGWSEPEFDDGDWRAAGSLGEHPVEPWTRLRPQSRTLTREEISPKSLERVGEDTYVADFGRVYAGVPRVRFADGESGRRMELCAGYRLDGEGRVDRVEGTQHTDMRFACVQRDGEQLFRPFHYLGFRYLEIEAPGEELTPAQVSLLARRHDAPEEATFAARGDGADTLEAVYDLCRHSARYGAQEAFVDTPTREKGQFLADAHNTAAVTARAFGERRLSRAAIAEFVRSHSRYWAAEGRVNAVYPNGDGKRDIPEFSALLPAWLAEHFEVTDDRETLSRTYPVLRAVSDYLARHLSDAGLVANLSGGAGGPYEEGIVDWPPEMRYGYDRDWPVRTTVNALAANAFRRTADVAAALDRSPHEIERQRERRARLVTAMNDHLREDGVYVDGASADGAERSEHASQHANACALAFDIVPEGDAGPVLDTVRGRGIEMGPMTVRWLLRAFETTEATDATLDLLTDASTDGWADLLERGGTFTWETWHARDGALPEEERHNRSESHAMGATALVAIQRQLLGVRFDGPGARELAVRPPADALEAAEGTVPTDRGDIEVAWEREPFSLSLSVPWNTTARVELPLGEVSESGVELTPGESPDSLPEGIASVEKEASGRTAVTVSSGTYRFEG